MLVGATLLVLALRGLLWYSVDSAKGLNVAGTGFTFADLRGNADNLTAPVTGAYFNWLAWLLLVGVTVVGVAANLPTRAADGLRVAGLLIGLLGLVATYYALAQLFNAQRAAGGSSHSVWHNSSFGVWAAFAGFALATIGAGIGPRRAR